jgi:hypothetical protein
MHGLLRASLWTGTAAAWVLATACSFTQLWNYEAAAGLPAQAPVDWPVGVTMPRSTDRPTLVMLLHPKCPCSRASVGELAKLMTRCHGKLSALVLVLRPADEAKGWEQTDLWRTAASIPGVIVKADDDGSESRRFGGKTSGQAMLYSPEGHLLFAGGITESRGHSGDNAGRSLIEALVNHEIDPNSAQRASTPVYGCPLFAPATRPTNGETSCRK